MTLINSIAQTLKTTKGAKKKKVINGYYSVSEKTINYVFQPEHALIVYHDISEIETKK